MTELQKYHLSMDIQIPKEVSRKSVEEYIRSQIFVEGWGESFKSNYIHADRFSLTPASTEPMYSISESEIDDLCLTSIDIGVYNPGDFQHEVAREKRMRTLHNIFARGSAQQAPTERDEKDRVLATKFGCDNCGDKNKTSIPPECTMSEDEYRKVKANFIEMAQYVLLFGLIFAVIFGFIILGAR